MKHTYYAKREYRAGFTLLEVLLVTTIIGIMAAVTLTFAGDIRSRKEVEVAGREMTGVLREVQQYALTGRQIVANTTPCTFSVSWNAGSGSYTANYSYRDSNGVCNLSSTINTYTHKNGVIFTNTGTVTFQVPYGTPTFPGTSVGANLSKQSVVGAICTYQMGRVENVVGTTTCP